MNKFKICDKCKATNVKTLVNRLKEIDSTADISIGCVSVCGIGRNKSFVILNDILITAENENELIEKVNLFINK